MHRFICLGVLALLALGGCASNGSIEARHDRFDAFAHADAEFERLDFANRLVGMFRESFGSALGKRELSETADRDLELLFRAASLVTFYAGTETMPAMEAVLSELEAREQATSRHHVTMYDIYVRERFFDRAAALRAAHPSASMQPLPVVIDDVQDWSEGLPSELVVGRDDATLTRQRVVLGDEAGVIVVFHPGCHFSANAFAAIETDPALRQLILPHAKWLAPARDALHFDTLQEWNHEHPAAPVSIAYRAEEWPMIDSWATPTFYFMKQGVVVTRVAGWPQEGNRPALLQAARTAGLQTRPDG